MGEGFGEHSLCDLTRHTGGGRAKHPALAIRNVVPGPLLEPRWLPAGPLGPALGLPSQDVITPNADDARFSAPVWTDSASWDIIKEWYLAFTRRLEDMFFETPGLSDKERRRSAFWLRKWLNRRTRRTALQRWLGARF